MVFFQLRRNHFFRLVSTRSKARRKATLTPSAFNRDAERSLFRMRCGAVNKFFAEIEFKTQPGHSSVPSGNSVAAVVFCHEACTPCGFGVHSIQLTN
jgi:hypothetical protein